MVKNGNSGEEGVLMRNFLHGGGMDIFWNYTIGAFFKAKSVDPKI